MRNKESGTQEELGEQKAATKVSFFFLNCIRLSLFSLEQTADQSEPIFLHPNVIRVLLIIILPSLES